MVDECTKIKKNEIQSLIPKNEVDNLEDNNQKKIVSYESRALLLNNQNKKKKLTFGLIFLICVVVVMISYIDQGILFFFRPTDSKIANLTKK
jgi:hypothetical protein